MEKTRRERITVRKEVRGMTQSTTLLPRESEIPFESQRGDGNLSFQNEEIMAEGRMEGKGVGSAIL